MKRRLNLGLVFSALIVLGISAIGQEIVSGSYIALPDTLPADYPQPIQMQAAPDGTLIYEGESASGDQALLARRPGQDWKRILSLNGLIGVTKAAQFFSSPGGIGEITVSQTYVVVTAVLSNGQNSIAWRLNLVDFSFNRVMEAGSSIDLQRPDGHSAAFVVKSFTGPSPSYDGRSMMFTASSGGGNVFVNLAFDGSWHDFTPPGYSGDQAFLIGAGQLLFTQNGSGAANATILSEDLASGLVTVVAGPNQPILDEIPTLCCTLYANGSEVYIKYQVPRGGRQNVDRMLQYLGGALKEAKTGYPYQLSSGGALGFAGLTILDSKPSTGAIIGATQLPGFPDDLLFYDGNTARRVLMFQSTVLGQPVNTFHPNATALAADGSIFTIMLSADGSYRLVDFLKPYLTPTLQTITIGQSATVTVANCSALRQYMFVDGAGLPPVPVINGVVVNTPAYSQDGCTITFTPRAMGTFPVWAVLVAPNEDQLRLPDTSDPVASVTVNSITAPAITGISPKSILQSQSLTVTITGLNLTGAVVSLPASSGVSITGVQTGPTSIAASLTAGPGALAGAYPLTVTTGSGAVSVTFTVNLDPTLPVIASVSVAGASLRISGNSWTEIKGSNLGSLEMPPSPSQTVGGASITFCGISAVLSYNGGSLGQINALVPPSAGGKTSCPVVLTVNGRVSAPFVVAMVDEAWAVSTYPVTVGGSQVSLPVVTRTDNSWVGPPGGLVAGTLPTTPAKKGEQVVIWATGCVSGPTPLVTVGGILPQINSAGPFGGLGTGVCHLDLLIPPAAQSGNNRLVVAGVEAGSIAVQ